MNFVRHHAVIVAMLAVAVLVMYIIVAVTSSHDTTVDVGLGMLGTLVAISIVWDIAFHGRNRP